MFVASLRETFNQQIKKKILHAHVIELHSTVKLMNNFKFNIYVVVLPFCSDNRQPENSPFMQYYCNEYAFLFTKELDQTVLICSV